MEAAGAPLKRLNVSDDCAPISTRPTSLTRTTEPSGLARITMFSNCETVLSRPSVSIGS